MTKVAFADDHTLVRRSIAEMLNAHSSRCRIILQANNGLELIGSLEKSHELPDVCLLDLNMPEMDGYKTLLELRQRWPGINVLVLTSYDEDMLLVRMIQGGANGYMLKGCSLEELDEAIVAVATQGTYFPERVTAKFFGEAMRNRQLIPELNEQERIILKLICQDLGYFKIAEQMHLSIKTVEWHSANLFKKFRVRSRTGLALCAVKFGLVFIDPII